MTRIYKSLYGEVPPVPSTNAHYLFNPPTSQSTDYLLHIDGLTGFKRTKKQFWERVKDAATALSTPESEGGPGIGLQDEKEEIVGILSHNCMDYVVLIHTLLYLGAPLALVPAFSTPFELVHILRIARLSALFVHASLYPAAVRAAREAGLAEDRIWLLDGQVPGKKNLGEMIEEVRVGKWSRKKKAEVKQVGKDHLAYLVFSSGTSGLPKAVMISHGNIRFMTNSGSTSSREDTGPLDPNRVPPVVIAFLPFYHTYGLHYLCFRGFVNPMTYVIVPKWDLEFVLSLIPKYKINLLLLIPSTIHQIAYYKDLEKYDFSSVTILLSGAAYLPPQLAQKVSKAFPSVLTGVSEGYGLSETTLSAIHSPTPLTFNGRIKHIPGSCGILNPGFEARIVRVDGTDADVDEPGELWLRGGSIAMGYWKNDKATAETFVADGWLRTGDTFRVDGSQRYFFVDRAKDTLKVSGSQVSPTEIEITLLAHPEKLIQDVCVAGVSGGRTSDEKVPRAWIVLNEAGRQQGESTVIAKLDKWIQQSLSKYKWLRGGFEVVDQIPKSPTGKVLRRVLQSGYEARQTKASAKL